MKTLPTSVSRDKAALLAFVVADAARAFCGKSVFAKTGFDTAKSGQSKVPLPTGTNRLRVIRVKFLSVKVKYLVRISNTPS